ncbi:hypothetical protein ANCCEY_01250 [Ancylostoma ceylanicum]|uniref:Uncharacterized protein n=1 Tax=Ancylostoma ceylanicum TaxID=53326 RepID=A0A0D6MAN2_9BILA|nr:hypothetical protein ANCCEY_01250 [Ancylostoma ceylanicum]
MLRTALILFTFNVVRRSLASYCGQAAIPFTFQKCEEKFTSQGCAPGQWLGGIAPKGLIQGATGLQVRCCWYAPLLDSEDRGVAMVTNRIDINPPAPNRAVMDTVYAAVPPKASSPYVLQQQLPNYGVAAAPAPRYIPPQGQAASGVANGYQLQTLNSLPVAQQPIVQPQQYVSVQSPQAPGMQSVVVPTYPQYNHAPAPAQPAQPLGGLFNPVANPIIPAPQQLSMVLQQQQQQQPNTIPMAVPQQPQQQLQPQYVVQPISTTPLPTIPPLTFPTLDQIPKIDIPSVEDVENVIPPVQKAILTTVAKFFGVL